MGTSGMEKAPSSGMGACWGSALLSGVKKMAGSFMSFQKPAMPWSSRKRYCRPNQARAWGFRKSGKWVLPGQTTATKSLPSARWQKKRFFTPSS